MLFGPKQINIQEIGISSLGVFIAGFLGGLLLLAITFFISGFINIAGTFNDFTDGIGKTDSMFPFALSFITFIGSSVSTFLSYKILCMTAPERYKRSGVILGQIALFSLFSYILVTPLYIFLGLQSYDNIMYVFIAHVLLLSFGMSVVLEIMNNYRHILIGIYGSILGLFIAAFLSATIFTSFSMGTAKLLALVFLLPLINFCIIFFKELFSLVYYKYYTFTNQDPLGDIFYQIEMEEREELRDEEEKNMLN